MAGTPASARGVRRNAARASAAAVDIDLDAVAASQLATASITFRLAGREFHLGPAQSLPVDMLSGLDTGQAEKVIEAIGYALPEDERAAFAAARPTVGQVESLSRKWLAKSGLSLGESPASPESYGNTAGR